MTIQEMTDNGAAFTASDYSTDELMRLTVEAQGSRSNLVRYIKQIVAELRARACTDAEGA